LTLKTQAEAISRALTAGDFEEALRLDPKNPEGLVLKGKAEAEAKQKAKEISTALAAGDYEQVLRLDASMLPSEALSKLPADTILKLPVEVISRLPSHVVLNLSSMRNSIGLELKLMPAGDFTMGDLEMARIAFSSQCLIKSN
jgi:hypothetical protein